MESDPLSTPARQPPVGVGVFSPGYKKGGCEAEHFPPFSAEVKNAFEAYRHFSIRLQVMVLYLPQE